MLQISPALGREVTQDVTLSDLSRSTAMSYERGQASAKQVKAAGGWGGMEFFSKQNVTFESLWDDGLQMWQACSIADAPAFGWNHTRQNAWWCDNRLTNDPDTPWRRLFCCVEYQLNAVLIGAYKTQLEHWNIFFPLAHILVGLNVV